MIFKLESMNLVTDKRGVTLRCPACRHEGTFEARIEQMIRADRPRGLLGQRCCPNPKCKAHVFIAIDHNGEVLVSYPPERIDFDASSIPEPIVSSLEEAITCHANEAFIAAAIMVRRTLEELCAQKEVAGDDLNAQIRALGSSGLFPPEFLSALTERRWLGNDATHVKSKHYTNIGKPEVELAIDVTKEMLKSIFQFNNLLQGLKDLKQAKSPSANTSPSSPTTPSP